VTPYERSTIAQQLRAHVAANPNGRYRIYLSELADLYEANAQLSAQNKPICWPPWDHLASATPFGLGALTNAPRRSEAKPVPFTPRPVPQTAADFDDGFADDGRE